MKNNKLALRLLSLLLMLSMVLSAIPALAEEEGQMEAAMQDYPSLEFTSSTYYANEGDRTLTFYLTYEPVFKDEMLGLGIFDTAEENCYTADIIEEHNEYYYGAIPYTITLDISMLKAGTYTAIALMQYYSYGQYRISPYADKATVVIRAKSSGTKVKSFVLVQRNTTTALNGKTIKMKKGKTFALTAVKFKPSNAKNTKVVWNSSNKKVAVVNKNGVIKAVGKGNCTITCMTTDGGKIKRSVKIVVK